MKVVLFCGGQGMRLREYSESIPKPMVPIGPRPILWHIMKYYAHYGHKDFVLCLGWQANAIKEYFLNYNECTSNDFVMNGSSKSVDMLNTDIHDWKITFVDTGATSNIGQRLMAVRKHLKGEEMFLANYSDGLADVDMSEMIDFHKRNDAIATFMSIRPTQTFHTVALANSGKVSQITAVTDANVWINGGFFVLNQSIFDYMEEGDELVVEPFRRLIAEDHLYAYRHEGFFGCMDTYKEKQMLDDMYQKGNTPWEIWKHAAHQQVTRTTDLVDDMIRRLDSMAVPSL